MSDARRRGLSRRTVYGSKQKPSTAKSGSRPNTSVRPSASITAKLTFAYEEGACRRTALSVELFVDTSSDCFGKRDAPLLRPALEAAILVGRQLDLRTHHDVAIMV